ncbi:hypothetical protein [Nocardioides bruguierae]|uniref:NHL repeat-containing protein n=1 Tax=Nocardioides bruguierae TaxID=2945102 RepID=A0A9X2DAG7_9ACTN|nr:hypothetical protein [Nocardioides bruguierae]MCM0621014.1 hypothetical protein [Nocardioides bruguierae]
MTDTVHLGHLALTWDQAFLAYPSTPGWAHHDVAELPDGRLVAGHPDGRSLRVHRPDGSLLHEVDLGAVETHGLTVDPATAQVWVADNGHKYTPDQPDYDEIRIPGRLLKVTADGERVGELVQPDTAAYERATWAPTAMLALDDGGLWVSEGYGLSLLHRYDADGTYRETVDGSDSGTPFDTPHAIVTRTVAQGALAGTEMLVADRANHRIVVLDTAGRTLRTFGAEHLTSPSGIAVLPDGTLLVTDLFGALVALTSEGDLVGRLGVPTPEAEQRDAWPNERRDGLTVRPPLEPMRLNSPHGIHVTSTGGVLVTEWVIGGRVVRLTPA